MKKLQENIHTNAKHKGFWENNKDMDSHIIEKVCLIHSEVSEALECYRNGEMRTNMSHGIASIPKPSGFPSELADIIIRTLDLAEALGIDMDKEIHQKCLYNEIRSFKHGKKI